MSQDKKIKLNIQFHSSASKSFSQNSELIILLGKSNVGKSSFINWLADNKGLAFVSKTPGRTKLLNYYDLKIDNSSYFLIDTPGYGYSKIDLTKKKQIQRSIKDLFDNQQKFIKLVIFLFDLRQNISENDLLIYDFFKNYQHLVVFTKSDKINQQNKIILLKSHLSRLELNLKDNYFLHSKFKKTFEDRQKFLFFLKYNFLKKI